MINETHHPYLIAQLENNKTNHEFMNYGNDDKNIIISAGISMFLSGHRDVISSENSKVKNIIMEMENNHHAELSQKRIELAKIKDTNEREINTRIRELQDKHAKSFRDLQAEIDSLSSANQKLRENDNWKDYQKLLDQYKQESDTRNNEQKQLYSELIKTKATKWSALKIPTCRK